MEGTSKSQTSGMDQVLQFEASQSKFIMYLLLLLPVLGILLAACGGGGGGGGPAGT